MSIIIKASKVFFLIQPTKHPNFSKYMTVFLVQKYIHQIKISQYSEFYLLHILIIFSPTQLHTAKEGYTVDNIVVNHQLFADDICAFGSSICGLQHLLNAFCDCAGESKIYCFI